MKKGQVRFSIIIVCAVVILSMAGCSVRTGPITFTVEVYNSTEVHVWFITNIPGAMANLIGAGQSRNFPTIPKGTLVEFHDHESNPIWIEATAAFTIAIHQDHIPHESHFSVQGQGTPRVPDRIVIGPPVV